MNRKIVDVSDVEYIEKMANQDFDMNKIVYKAQLPDYVTIVSTQESSAADGRVLLHVDEENIVKKISGFLL